MDNNISIGSKQPIINNFNGPSNDHKNLFTKIVDFMKKQMVGTNTAPPFSIIFNVIISCFQTNFDTLSKILSSPSSLQRYQPKQSVQAC